jgi:hypothetical protein
MRGMVKKLAGDLREHRYNDVMARKVFAVAVLLLIAGLGFVGYRMVGSGLRPASSITGLPVTMKLKQRSTTIIPGSNDKVSVSIDDITDRQVMVTLVQADGKPVMGARSLQARGTTPFEFDGTTYTLAVDKLDDSLLGDDYATITISTGGTQGSAEMQKIELLIAKVENLKGAVFIRNGTEHSPAEAVKLLRHKLGTMDPATVTAGQFIEQAGTKSSTTGVPYQIRFSDGRTIPSADFLHEKLKELAKS